MQERNGFREEWKTRGSISVLNYDRNVSRAREVVVVVDNKAEDEGDVFIKRTINSFKQFLWNNSKNHFRVFVFSSQIFFFFVFGAATTRAWRRENRVEAQEIWIRDDVSDEIIN